MREKPLLKVQRPIVAIDNIRIAAPAPLYNFNDVTAEHGIWRNGICWRNYSIPRFYKPYIYAVSQLSRYANGRYEKKRKYTKAPFQNNRHPYTYESASAFVRQAIYSYVSLSTSLCVLDKEELNITKIECAFDLPASAPTLDHLIRYISRGRGSGARRLEIMTNDGNIYAYSKTRCRWHDKSYATRYISDSEYFKQIFQRQWSVYVGSRNYRIIIYRKGNRIRHEIAYKGSAAVKKVLAGRRHVSAIEDRTAVENLFRETARRIYELYQVNEIPSVETAIRDALASFPEEKHEPCKPECMAFHIDLGAPAVLINKVNLITVYVTFILLRAFLYSTEICRIRAPP